MVDVEEAGDDATEQARTQDYWRETSRPTELPAATGQTGHWIFWKLHTAGWAFIALYGFSARTLAFSDAGTAFKLTLALDSIGYVLTALMHVFLLSRVRKITTAPVILTVAGLCLAGGMLQTWLAWQMRDHFFPLAQTLNSPVMPAIFYTSTLFGWALAYFCLRADHEAGLERLRRSKAQTEAMRSELEQLRLQLAPHFLFNALNSVTAEIHERPDIALEMVRKIAGYLRYCLNQQSRDLYPLAEEIEAMHAYLHIQEVRFEDRLTCTVNVDPAARDFLVPHMILQGLVENAVKHGLKHDTDSIHVKVDVERMNAGDVRIRVSNPGMLIPPDDERQASGLTNIKRRLNIHFPKANDLSIREAQGIVVAQIILKGSACTV
ncbi:histidine kinase [Labrenzia sp. 011]|uniref:sensor histidine kinase n=1 Tax=Labrenzia sp. 011 TaxID=2171494 RepID=UPI000D50CE0C|nr:histidine kinase [Labrenzia sp. 011]PVB59352.1 histidine kinase [Labrenzia sp. 011]